MRRMASLGRKCLVRNRQMGPAIKPRRLVRRNSPFHIDVIVRLKRRPGLLEGVARPRYFNLECHPGRNRSAGALRFAQDDSVNIAEL